MEVSTTRTAAVRVVRRKGTRERVRVRSGRRIDYCFESWCRVGSSELCGGRRRWSKRRDLGGMLRVGVCVCVRQMMAIVKIYQRTKDEETAVSSDLDCFWDRSLEYLDTRSLLFQKWTIEETLFAI